MIKAEGLTKQYGSKTVVDDVSFTVRPGVVTGFLGPNGAGKSTTLRLMLGLDHGQGRTTFKDRPYNEIANPSRTVGVLLDPRSVHPARSARNHLRMLAAGAGIHERRVDEVLEIVGLTSAASKMPRTFSLGMQQRLGLATALLGDPEHLILDEPANGLDPEGIHWMRGLLQQLVAEGRTVLVSSHLLSEMAQMAQDLIVIGAGKLISSGTTKDFIAQHSHTEVVVKTPQPALLEGWLNHAGYQTRAEPPMGLVVPGSNADAVSALAARNGIQLHELHTRSSGLEEAFLAATSDAVEYRAA